MKYYVHCTPDQCIAKSGSGRIDYSMIVQQQYLPESSNEKMREGRYRGAHSQPPVNTTMNM